MEDIMIIRSSFMRRIISQIINKALKKQKLEEENKLLQAKTEAINATKDNEELYREVLKAMREYSGEDDGEGSEVFME